MAKAKRMESGDPGTRSADQLESKNRTAAVFITSEFDALHVRRVVASNPNTPRQVLERLASEESPVIRRHVALNPKTPVETLRKLAEDRETDVRLAVAENAQTPQEILTLLSNDQDMDVRYGVAENPHMPENILVELSQDDNPYIRCRALKTLQMLAPDVQTRLKLIIQHQQDRLR
ncbi:MAG: HEAT repeat domain-containing protein [Candidatus Melainabacteria bacterium]|nr:HEAT repeat domain-containing protein [Candidatus Melainabacteria bacterium]